MLTILRQLAARLTCQVSAKQVPVQVESPKPKVPYYFENWGCCEIGGSEVIRGVLVLVIPDTSAPLHGMEIQLHRYSGTLRMSIYLCPRPPLGSAEMAGRARCLGLPLAPGVGSPLGKRIEFLQQHLTRGFAGCGPSLAFEPTDRNLEILFVRLSNAEQLIPDARARESVVSFLEHALKRHRENSIEQISLSTSSLPKRRRQF